jgi:hypothetical protein
MCANSRDFPSETATTMGYSIVAMRRRDRAIAIKTARSTNARLRKTLILTVIAMDPSTVAKLDLA